MSNTTVLGVKLHKRTKVSQKFQEVLSKHGCIIKTRIGLHQASSGVCSPDGVILLDLIGDDSDISALENDLKELDGAEVQKMVFKTEQ